MVKMAGLIIKDQEYPVTHQVGRENGYPEDRRPGGQSRFGFSESYKQNSRYIQPNSAVFCLRAPEPQGGIAQNHR